MQSKTLILTSIFLVLLCTSLKAQKQANIWYFSDYGLEFNSTPAKLIFDSAPHQNRGMAVMSDSLGNLLFYSDGFNVWNRNHQKMPNGKDLLTLPQSPSTQASLVVPKPGSKTIYYLFTVDPHNAQTTSGLYYSTIDMSLQGGLGDVTVRPVKLMGKTTQKIGAVFHGNRKDVWVMAHEYGTNKYSAFLVSKDGISAPVVTAIGGTSEGIIISMKFSPDGKQMATPFENGQGGINIFDFNSVTGVLSNTRTITQYGGVFSYSPDGHYLYTRRYSSIVQLDVTLPTAEQIMASATSVASWMFNDPWEWQLATDGKIYVTKGGGGGGTGHLGVIHFPNKKGTACQVVENHIDLQGHSSFVTYMPRFIESYFFKPDLRIIGNCLGDSTYFSLTNESFADSIRWSFGDQATGRSFKVAHRYSAAGTYQVECTIYYGMREERFSVSHQINVKPVFSLGPDKTVCEGFVLKPDRTSNQYLWSTGAESASLTPAASGAFWLQETNNFNCFWRDTVNLVVNRSPKVKLGGDTVICNNVRLMIQSKFANPGVAFLWSNGSTEPSVSVTSPGWYWLEARTAEGCTNRDSVFFAFKAAPTVNLGSDTTLFRDSMITLDAGDFGYPTTYLWENGWAARSRTVAPWQMAPGHHTMSVRVKVPNGCEGYDEIDINVLNITDVEDPVGQLQVYPIPATTTLNIVSNSDDLKRAEIVSMMGQKMCSIPFREKNVALSISSLTNGTYVLIVYGEDGVLRRMLFQKVN